MMVIGVMVTTTTSNTQNVMRMTKFILLHSTSRHRVALAHGTRMNLMLSTNNDSINTILQRINNTVLSVKRFMWLESNTHASFATSSLRVSKFEA